MIWSWALVFIGGGLGSMTRFAFSKFLDPHLQYKNFPFPTFLVNLISCFVLGLLFNKMLHSGLSPSNKLLLATGFCGGFSTFSTFSFEILQLMMNGNHTVALIYLISSVILGILLIYVGFIIH